MARLNFWGGKRRQDKAGEAGKEAGHLEFEQIRAVLESFQASRIKDRLDILAIFLGIERHVTIPELVEAVKDDLPLLDDKSFLLETMDMFCQLGFAQRRTFENQEPRYEHRHLGKHHDHFICTRCGLIQEFSNNELERLQMVIAREFQFHPLQHKMEIYGLCSNCMAKRDPMLPLVLAARGEVVRIAEIKGGRELNARLADMGLAVGSTLELIGNQTTGPVIVAVNGVRLALGAEMARKIFVTHACGHDR